MAEKEPGAWERKLPVLALIFAGLIVGLAMWPHRHQYATLSFWLMAFGIAVGGLGIFTLLVAGLYEGLDALKRFAIRVPEPTSDPAAQPASDPTSDPTSEQARIPMHPPIVFVSGSSAPPELEESGISWVRLRPSVSPLSAIPDPPSGFRGRQKELDELSAAIGEGSVTIYGIGGVGKTALALKLAQRLAPAYPDARIFLDLKAGSASLTATDVMGHVIRTVDYKAQLPGCETGLSKLYATTLVGKQGILVLDDADSAEQIRALLPPTSWAAVITSRRSLELPGVHQLDLGPLDEDTAQDLVCDLALGTEAWSNVIVGLCEGVPLAVKAAAGALAKETIAGPEACIIPLRDHRNAVGPVDAALTLSYDRLDERFQRPWARLAVFSIPFDLDAAAAVWEMGPDTAADTLDRLVRSGLVDEREGGERFLLHRRARALAHRKLVELEDPRPVHRLAAAYLEARPADSEWSIVPEETLEAVRQWERAEAWKQFAESANRAAGRLHTLGYWKTVESQLERALEAVEERLRNPDLKAALLNNVGVIARKRGQLERAIDAFQEGLSIYERVGDAAERAAASVNLANAYADQGAWDRAIEIYQASLEVFERVGDSRKAAGLRMGLGSAHENEEQWGRAIEAYQQALQIYESLGDLEAIIRAADSLGRACARNGEWRGAIDAHLKDLKSRQRMGDVAGMTATWLKLGLAYAAAGEWERAFRMVEQSLEIRRSRGDVRGTAESLQILGRAYSLRGEWGRAIEYWQQSLEISQRLGEKRRIAELASDLGRAYAQRGDRAQALVSYRQSLELFQEMGDAQETARAWAGLGSARANEGEWHRAIEMYQRCLEAVEGTDDAYNKAAVRLDIGRLHLRAGEPEKARPHLRYAVTVLAHLGSPHADDAVRALAEACGSVEAAQAYAAGLSEAPQAD